MRPCTCSENHVRRRIVLTGGPGAGKTAVLELCRQLFCHHVMILPESASLLFSGGFPRGDALGPRAATQRAIFHVQRELERIADYDGAAIVLCDRGTVDGAAYWPGPNTLFDEVGTTHAAELQRYDSVIHLRTPSPATYNHDNPLRIESALEAAAIDERISEAWRQHPDVKVVDNSVNFLDKAHRALACLRAELPSCCSSQLPL
jgi:predicted ATPase